MWGKKGRMAEGVEMALHVQVGIFVVVASTTLQPEVFSLGFKYYPCEVSGPHSTGCPRGLFCCLVIYCSFPKQAQTARQIHLKPFLDTSARPDTDLNKQDSPEM